MSIVFRNLDSSVLNAIEVKNVKNLDVANCVEAGYFAKYEDDGSISLAIGVDKSAQICGVAIGEEGTKPSVPYQEIIKLGTKVLVKCDVAVVAGERCFVDPATGKATTSEVDLGANVGKFVESTPAGVGYAIVQIN